MAKRRIYTPERVAFIKANASTMTCREMADNLGLRYNSLHNYTTTHKIVMKKERGVQLEPAPNFQELPDHIIFKDDAICLITLLKTS